MAGRKGLEADIFVARESFSCEVDGVPMIVNRGERVRRGHPLLRSQPGFFDPVDTSVQYDVEQATAAPGEQRQR